MAILNLKATRLDVTSHVSLFFLSIDGLVILTLLFIKCSLPPAAFRPIFPVPVALAVFDVIVFVVPVVDVVAAVLIVVFLVILDDVAVDFVVLFVFIVVVQFDFDVVVDVENVVAVCRFCCYVRCSRLAVNAANVLYSTNF